MPMAQVTQIYKQALVNLIIANDAIHTVLTWCSSDFGIVLAGGIRVWFGCGSNFRFSIVHGFNSLWYGWLWSEFQ